MAGCVVNGIPVSFSTTRPDTSTPRQITQLIDISISLIKSRFLTYGTKFSTFMPSLCSTIHARFIIAAVLNNWYAVCLLVRGKPLGRNYDSINSFH